MGVGGQDQLDWQLPFSRELENAGWTQFCEFLVKIATGINQYGLTSFPIADEVTVGAQGIESQGMDFDAQVWFSFAICDFVCHGNRAMNSRSSCIPNHQPAMAKTVNPSRLCTRTNARLLARLLGIAARQKV